MKDWKRGKKIFLIALQAGLEKLPDKKNYKVKTPMPG